MTRKNCGEAPSSLAGPFTACMAGKCHRSTQQTSLFTESRYSQHKLPRLWASNFSGRRTIGFQAFRNVGEKDRFFWLFCWLCVFVWCFVFFCLRAALCLL